MSNPRFFPVQWETGSEQDFRSYPAIGAGDRPLQGQRKVPPPSVQLFGEGDLEKIDGVLPWQQPGFSRGGVRPPLPQPAPVTCSARGWPDPLDRLRALRDQHCLHARGNQLDEQLAVGPFPLPVFAGKTDPQDAVPPVGPY